MSGQLTLAVGLILIALLLASGGLVTRWVLIIRRGGVVECALRYGAGTPWRHGLAEYQPGQLSWYRSLSPRLRANASFDRAELQILRSRTPSAAEATRLGPGVIIAECSFGSPRAAGGKPATRRLVELAMSEAALTGLLAWLESSPQFYLRAS